MNLFGRSVIQYICLFDVYLFVCLKSHLIKKCFIALNLYEAVNSPGLVVQLILKRLLMKQTHDDNIKAKEGYIQLSFGRYKGKLVLRYLSPSVLFLFVYSIYAGSRYFILRGFYSGFKNKTRTLICYTSI